MGDSIFFRKNWKFVNREADDDKVKNPRRYPLTHSLIIGNDRGELGTYMAAWLDADGDLHVFRHLKLNEGRLEGINLMDLGAISGDNPWIVTIEQDGENLKGRIEKPESEGNLAGTWGAEAQPTAHVWDLPSERHCRRFRTR
ncbi:MAG TPA: hypothetical protein VN851_18555 [Thermoanaerobaculia bacterium]|nr:hypothetical protein [Thermoanaerobaculia bacterium]